ncbi:MAG TPA: ADOP family duplicated permease [Gemmatimonadaceae bacterium]|jgi:predicted permease
MSVQRDIDAELRFHLETRVEELMEQGVARDEARARALREFGNVDEVRDGLQAIDRRVANRRSRMEMLSSLLQDLKYAVRSLRNAPAMSITIVLTLALGIGVNAAMFTLLDVIYLRAPTGVSAPDALRRVWIERRFRDGSQYWQGFDYASFAAIAREMDGRAQTTVYRQPDPMRVGRGESAPMARVSGTTSNFFSVLGVKVARGRFFTAAESAPQSSAAVAVISDQFWSTYYNRANDVIGKTVELNRRKLTIIGVAAPGFDGIDLTAVEVWAPVEALFVRVRPGWEHDSNVNGFQVILRLPPDAPEGELAHRVTAAVRANDRTARFDATSVTQFGAINVERGPGKVSMEMRVATRLAGVAIIVLLIACANVVNLLLARAISRRREIAVRLALGVSRARLIRLLVAESTLLGLASGVAALLAAVWCSHLIRKLLMPDVIWHTPMLHWRALVFALGCALAAGVLTGLVPALQNSSPSLTEGLKAGARNFGGTRSRLRSTLVTAQAALSVVLLVGAVLFVRSLSNVKARTIGYSVDRLVFGSASYEVSDSVRDAGYSDRLRAMEPTLAAIPGVSHVAYTTMRPKSGISWERLFTNVDTLVHKPPLPFYTAVSPNFFAATGGRIVRGRTFAAERGTTGPASVIINQTFADALWPNENPLGQCIRFVTPTSPCATIIGVAATAMESSLDEKPESHVYISLDRPAFKISGASTVIVDADPARIPQIESMLREALRAEFVGAIPRTITMQSAMAPDYRPWELGAKLFTLFGVLALIVAAIGVYSSIAYAVGQRTHEFGVRMALGARSGDVLRQVLGEGLKTSLFGVAVGIVLAVAAGRLVRSLLYGVDPTDPMSLIIVAAILVGIALLAASRPAWRASRADPVAALRAE